LKDVIYLIETGSSSNHKSARDGKSLLYIATENGNYLMAKYLIEKEADINASSENQTPLHIAYKKKHFDIFHYLILVGAELKIKNNEKQTLVLKEEKVREYRIVNLLLNYGAIINRDHYYVVYNYTDLHFASECGHLHNLKFLVEKGVDVNAKDQNNRTGLHLASEQGHLRIVQCLTEKGADVDAKTRYEQTPLHLASFMGHLEIAQ
jgi:ankyrin repeat protein